MKFHNRANRYNQPNASYRAHRKRVPLASRRRGGMAFKFFRRKSRTMPLRGKSSAGDDELERPGENSRLDGGTAETANDEPEGPILKEKFRPNEGAAETAANDELERRILEEKIRPNGGTAKTAANVLVFSLKTLGTLSGSIPMVGALGGIIDALLGVVGQVQQTSTNEQSLVQLAARIERLTPIVSKMAESDPERGKGIVENLHKELAGMTQQLNAAKAEGKLDRFFNSTDNSAILDNHNMALDQMIADSTFLTVHDIAKSVRDLENSKMQQLHPEITGGTGGPGGSGHVGGEGGEGGGPQIDMDPGERAQIGNVSGGTGGTGGVGVQVGGKGGTGKGPVINLRRMRAFTSPEP
ncbi:hypothetical protein MSAN_02438200 [Mycena sanguinolenta]|uniref:Uncharacterized protein n=1 Tax=Mycena sanguinolenta TaxID=230812 RepID=A0A8H7CBG2_9AGAR|nr:hypothetical protein MSAN_02438200 [Mycena sanguinolenta]